jgi:hypothetical protein
MGYQSNPGGEVRGKSIHPEVENIFHTSCMAAALRWKNRWTIQGCAATHDSGLRDLSGCDRPNFPERQ